MFREAEMKDLSTLNVLGVMSGTSLDGIDAVLVRLEQTKDKLEWQVLDRETLPYRSELRERLHRAIKPETSNIVLITQLHAEVGVAYAELVSRMQERNNIDLVALSGQTVYHIPRFDEARGWHTVSTLQLGEAAIVAERCQTTVISDFRQSDMAAGGQGAPMVAFGDFKLFSDIGKTRAIHNLGGISNLTYLPANGNSNEVFAFDTGPANCLIDEAVKRYFGLEYDKDGRFASSGQVDDRVLAELMNHPYFKQPLPKTTGRETFTLSELEETVTPLHLAPRDLVATLTAFTAVSIAQAYRDFVLPKGLDEILLAGGGALNPALMTMLRERLPIPLKTFEELGWQSKDREALAFAVMGYVAYHGLTNTLPRATGANHATIAGKVSRANTSSPRATTRSPTT
jgi:anhydro-N-acetylmuramic acid kinase